MTDKIRKESYKNKHKFFIYLIHFKSSLFECLGDTLLEIIWIRWSDSISRRGTIQCLLKQWKKVDTVLQLLATMDRFTWLADVRLELWTPSKCLFEMLKFNLFKLILPINFAFFCSVLLWYSLLFVIELKIKRKFFFNQEEFIQLAYCLDRIRCKMENIKFFRLFNSKTNKILIISIKSRYDARADQWREGPRMNTGRWRHALISDGTRLLAIGGAWR